MGDLPERVRAFIAVQVAESVRVQLREFQQRLERELPDVSWTRSDAIHLTLRFLGNIESACLDNLTGAVRAATSGLSAFDLSLGEAGSFGGRVIWIGIRAGAEPLCELSGKVRDAAAPFSGHVEDRAFSPHITIGRCRRPVRDLGAVLRKFALPRFEPWTVNAIEIIRSQLSPKGSTYTTLASIVLCETPRT